MEALRMGPMTSTVVPAVRLQLARADVAVVPVDQVSIRTSMPRVSKAAPAIAPTGSPVRTAAEALEGGATSLGRTLEAFDGNVDELAKRGVDHALAALSTNPKAGPEIAAHFARSHMSNALVRLPNTEELESLALCAPTLANRQGGADEVGAFAARILQEARRDGSSASSYASAFRGISDVVLSDGHPGSLMSATHLQDLAKLCEASLFSSRVDPDKDPRQWETIDLIARTATRLEKDSGGHFDAQFLFDWLEAHPTSSAIHLRAALDAGRPVSDTLMASTLEGAKKSFATLDDSNFVYNIDGVAAQLHDLRQAFDARGEDVARILYAHEVASQSRVGRLSGLVQKHLLEGQAPPPTPLFRLGLGDQDFAIGTRPVGADPASAFQTSASSSRGDKISADLSALDVPTQGQSTVSSRLRGLAFDDLTMAVGGDQLEVPSSTLSGVHNVSNLSRTWLDQRFSLLHEMYADVEKHTEKSPRAKAAMGPA